MSRLFLIVCFTGLLTACAHLPEFSGLRTPAQPKVSPNESSQYSFAWRLSGDRQVAPLQVFDNGKKTWLQFPEGHTVPAIFQRSAMGDRLLTYQRQGQYVVLSGVWPNLVLRGGSLQSRVDRVVDTEVGTEHSNRSSHEPSSPAPVAPLAVDTSATDELPAMSTAELTLASFSTVMADTEQVMAASPSEQDLSGQTTSIALAELSIAHSVSPQDRNLRSALMRWAAAAGWTFEAEHWAVDADIPIVGSATFDSRFKLAVQELVASTELADRPLQPCFYSNQVLRIVPYAQTCDRSAGLAAS